MVNGVAAATAVEALTPAQAGAQPTAVQTARFENQLQYSAPAADLKGFSSDFHSFMDFAGSLSSNFRSQLEHSGTNFNLEQWPELKVLQDASLEMRNLNLTTVQFQFVAAGVEITNRNAQTLFQQS